MPDIRMKITKKRLLVIAAIVLVIMGSAVAFGMWRLSSSDSQTAESPESGDNTPQSADSELVGEVNKKYGSGDYSGAIQLIEGQKNVKDVGTQLLLAGAYANSGDVRKALDMYKKLDAAGQLPKTSIGNMAEMAERAGEYQVAIDAYKRAKQDAISSKTESQDQIAVYDYKIAELERKR